MVLVENLGATVSTGIVRLECDDSLTCLYPHYLLIGDAVAAHLDASDVDQGSVLVVVVPKDKRVWSETIATEPDVEGATGNGRPEEVIGRTVQGNALVLDEEAWRVGVVVDVCVGGTPGECRAGDAHRHDGPGGCG